MTTDTTAPITEPAASTGRGADGSTPGVAWLLLVCGLVGAGASAMLILEKLTLLADPQAQLSCDINPIVACGSVIMTEQASLFGDVPNPVLGLAGFAAVATTGAAMLAGARLRSWYWLGLLAGVLGGVVMVHWLIYDSLYVIGALCPYCMVVWVVTMLVLVAVLTRFAKTGVLPRAVATYAPAVLVAWLGGVALLILVRWWDFWSLYL